MFKDAPILGANYSRLQGKTAVPLTPRGEQARREVETKLKNGSYQLETAVCYCGNDDDVVLATVERYRLPHRTVLCRACGLVRTDPRLDQASYTDFYTHYYRPLYERPQQTGHMLFNYQQANAQRRYQFIQQNTTLTSDAHILELGCGGGWNLLPFQAAGYNPVGYDYDQDYLTLGRSYGLALETGGRVEVEVTKQQFDLVILSHVVEHFADPIQEVRHLLPLLKPNGLLYVEVPSILGVKVNLLKYFQNAHTYSFVPQTLQSVMASAGYEMVAISPLIESLWRVGNQPLAAWECYPELAQQILSHVQIIERQRHLRTAVYQAKTAVAQLLNYLKRPQHTT